MKLVLSMLAAMVGAACAQSLAACNDLNDDGSDTTDDAFDCSAAGGTVNAAFLGFETGTERERSGGAATGDAATCCDIACVETGNTAADCLESCAVAPATVITAGTACAGDYTCVGGDGACTVGLKWYKYECTATGAYRTVYKSQTKPASTATGDEILTASNACADANKHQYGRQAVSAAGSAGYYKCTTQNYGDYQFVDAALFGDAAGTYKSLRNMCVAGKLQDQYFKTADCTGPGKLNDWGNTCTATPTVSAFTAAVAASTSAASPAPAAGAASTSAAVRVTAGLAAVLALLAFAA